MIIWHGSDDTPPPVRPKAGQQVEVLIGSSPIEPGQSVRVHYTVESRKAGHAREVGTREASWTENSEGKSCWRVKLGPFQRGDHVAYEIEGASPGGRTTAAGGSFEVTPRIWLALLWHQHQPLYRDLAHSSAQGAYTKPWVRLHALRDYYSMAALVAEQTDVHVTINLTPVLIQQLRDYAEHNATDRALDLTRTPAATLSLSEQEEVLQSFFEADWHNQIFIHSRYRELFDRRSAKQPFSAQDLRDLQMWFNLAWFGKEFRDGPATLITGEIVTAHRFVQKSANFSDEDIADMLGEQQKILRAILPLHRHLQDSGTIEISTTPYYHPILPLLADTDCATIDRPNTGFPRRFQHPEDAEAHVSLAVEQYRELFGRSPRGAWPAEGAVAEFVLPLLAQRSFRWIATDQGVLARSGKWGYRADLPEVLCRAYRADNTETKLALFFRATSPSDDIGFRFQFATDYAAVAREFIARLKRDYGSEAGDDSRVLTVALDGENAWGSYRDDGRTFLRALYQTLAEDPEVQTATFSEYLEHREALGADEQTVYELFTGSWIDEMGSAPGVDLGTWIGEAEENRAWELLGSVRDVLAKVPHEALSPEALQSLYAAEGSDWFWWFGNDQDSGSDQEFDDLFRTHLRNALHFAGRAPVAELNAHIIPHAVTWTFADQRELMSHQDRLVIRTNCPGTLEWWYGDEHAESDMFPVRGVMAGLSRYERALGPFPANVPQVVFRFKCRHVNCPGGDSCCRAGTHRVRLH